MRIFVGQSRFQGPIGRYASHFDMVEVRLDASLPRAARLAEWREAVPAAFVFSAVLPRSLAALEAVEDESALSRAEGIADALSAGWWVLLTPPSVTPTAMTRDRFKRLVERLRQSERRVAWEPRGPWTAEQAAAFAREVGVHRVTDLAAPGAESDVPEQSGEVLYTRLRALGPGARIGAGQIERVADGIEGVSEAYVIVEGAGASGVRKALREWLPEAPESSPTGSEVEEG